MQINREILLDDDALRTAARSIQTLCGDLEILRAEIEGGLKDLKNGFDTPAGRKYIASCEHGLIQPLKDLKVVLDHVSANLNAAAQTYQPVFQEYEQLNNSI